jgi:CCR4-NOT transcription complex subunit 1
MYYYFLSRVCTSANQHIASLSQHFQQYKEDPAAPPHNLTNHGTSAIAWRLLVGEAARAARDVNLGPQFALTVLSPMNATSSLPIPSLRLFGLPPQFLFSLAAYTLAASNVFPSSHPSYKHLEEILYQAYDGTMLELHSPGSNFWTYQISPIHAIFTEDLSMQEARTLLLAIYPRSAPLEGVDSRPPTPTNPTAPHPAFLETHRRAGLIQGLVRKFQSTALVLQTLTALSPGGPPRSPNSIPLEHILFELGELSKDDQVVRVIIERWWSPWILESEDSKLRNVEMTMTFHGLLQGLSRGRVVGVCQVAEALGSIVS